MIRIGLLLAFVFLAMPAFAAAMPACSAGNRAARSVTCVYDGDTGWERGRRWGLAEIDAPEIGARTAGCRAEQVVGLRARDRLRVLMARGYTIFDTAKRDRNRRVLVKIKLADGRDAATELLSEGLVQAWPHTGNRWCGR